MPLDFGDVTSNDTSSSSQSSPSTSYTPGIHRSSSKPATPQPSKTDPKGKVLFRAKLPRTPSELKSRATAFYVQQSRAGDGEDYRYKRWCIFVPDPFMRKDPKERTEKISRMIRDMRESFGAAIGRETLFLTFVKDNGEVDFGVAGQIMNALRYKRKDFPILIICDKPTLQIVENYEKRRKITADDKPNMLIIRFRGSTEDEVSRTMEMLQRELAKPDGSLLASKVRNDRFLIRVALAGRNVWKTGVRAGKLVAPIIWGYFNLKP